jgi:hypothetical protein
VRAARTIGPGIDRRARAANGALRLAERYFVAALTSLKTVLI